MEKLEYRLYDESQGYPALFRYESLDAAELACRMCCEYYVKDAQVYKAVSNASEPYNNCVIYVEKDGLNYPYADENVYRGITLEVREYLSRDNSSLMSVLKFNYHAEVLKYLQSDFIYIEHEDRRGEYKEVQLVCTEIDEDRGSYVYYGSLTGIALNK